MTVSTRDFLTRLEPLQQVQQVSLVSSKFPTGSHARDQIKIHSIDVLGVMELGMILHSSRLFQNIIIISLYLEFVNLYFFCKFHTVLFRIMPSLSPYTYTQQGPFACALFWGKRTCFEKACTGVKYRFDKGEGYKRENKTRYINKKIQENSK